MFTKSKIQKLRRLVADSLDEIKSIRKMNPILIEQNLNINESLELSGYFTESTGQAPGKNQSISNITFNLPSRKIGKISKIDDNIFKTPVKTKKTKDKKGFHQNSQNSNSSNLSTNARSNTYTKKREVTLNKLLQALLDIKLNKNKPVVSNLNIETIIDKNHDIKYYSQKIHEHYNLCLDNPSRENLNNFIRLLFLIGKFSTNSNCRVEFNKNLNEFNEASVKYKRFLRFGRILYQIWYPFSDADLLKMGDFGLYWLDKLTKDNVEYLITKLH